MAGNSQTHADKVSARRKDLRTLAEMLFHLSDPEKRHELEQYRIEYEAAFGATDLTKRYTSLWPIQDQEWLLANDTKRYFDGLPPFVKAYYKGKMEAAAKEGRLDDKSDEFIRLFVSGQMQLDDDKRVR